jgi:hypothetical protein
MGLGIVAFDKTTHDKDVEKLVRQAIRFNVDWIVGRTTDDLSFFEIMHPIQGEMEEFSAAKLRQRFYGRRLCRTV